MITMVSFDVGAAVRRAREAAGLTQAELAGRAGVSRMTVQKLEANEKDPRVSTTLVVFRALGLELVIVPSSIRPAVDDFVRAGGRLVGHAAGTTAPPSIVDVVAQKTSKAAR